MMNYPVICVFQGGANNSLVQPIWFLAAVAHIMKSLYKGNQKQVVHVFNKNWCPANSLLFHQNLLIHLDLFAHRW